MLSPKFISLTSDMERRVGKSTVLKELFTLSLILSEEEGAKASHTAGAEAARAMTILESFILTMVMRWYICECWNVESLCKCESKWMRSSECYFKIEW